MTRLQLALDDISLDEALGLLEQIHDYVDIVEVGTPFLIEYGVDAIRKIKKQFPDLYVLCDGKIMDAGAYEAEQMFAAGADCVTVLALTDDSTIRACVETAEKHHGDVMVDMICVSDLGARARELEALGAGIVAVHTGVDQQARGRTPLGDLIELKGSITTAQVAVAGGISEKTIDAYMAQKPDIVIVGGGIVHQTDRVTAAKNIHEMIRRLEEEQ